MTDAPERRRMGNSQGIGGGGVIEFDVLNRFSGDVQFSSEIDCENDASRYVKLGLAVKWALKNGSNLNGANGINDYIKCMHLEEWPITYTHDRLQIGCENHAIADWREFDDARILEMDGKRALQFWRKYKDHIFATIELCPAKDTGDE